MSSTTSSAHSVKQTLYKGKLDIPDKVRPPSHRGCQLRKTLGGGELKFESTTNELTKGIIQNPCVKHSFPKLCKTFVFEVHFIFKK